MLYHIQDFEDFPLFMAVQDHAQVHVDCNDFVTILLLIKSNRTGGELDLPEMKRCLTWGVGDAVILDSAHIEYGTREFTGGPADRLVLLHLMGPYI